MSDFSTNPLKVTRVFQLAAIAFLLEAVFPFCFLLCDYCSVSKVFGSITYSKGGSAVLRKMRNLK